MRKLNSHCQYSSMQKRFSFLPASYHKLVIYLPYIWDEPTITVWLQIFLGYCVRVKASIMQYFQHLNIVQRQQFRINTETYFFKKVSKSNSVSLTWTAWISSVSVNKYRLHSILLNFRFTKITILYICRPKFTFIFLELWTYWPCSVDGKNPYTTVIKVLIALVIAIYMQPMRFKK